MNHQNVAGKHIIIRGRVQGVGFRMFTQEQAKQLSIVGVVRNCSDASVEVKAFGDEKNLTQFISLLKQGPSASFVSAIDVLDLTHKNIYSDFSIIEDLEI